MLTQAPPKSPHCFPSRKKTSRISRLVFSSAETRGFEPPKDLTPYLISSELASLKSPLTTHTRLLASNLSATPHIPIETSKEIPFWFSAACKLLASNVVLLKVTKGIEC